MTTADALQQLKSLRDEAKTNMESFRDNGVFRDDVEALNLAITLLETQFEKERHASVEIGVVLAATVETNYEEYTHVYKTVPIQILNDGHEWHVAGENWRSDEE